MQFHNNFDTNIGRLWITPVNNKWSQEKIFYGVPLEAVENIYK